MGTNDVRRYGPNAEPLHQPDVNVDNQAGHYGAVYASGASWEDKRFDKVLSRVFQLFPHINTRLFTGAPQRAKRTQTTISAQREKSLWERAWSAGKSFILPPQDKDFYDDQLVALKEIQNINDPRFIGVLMGIADYDLKIGNPEFYDIYVLEAVDRVIASLIPSLRMDQLTKLKIQTEERLKDVGAYWGKNARDKGLERFAGSHIERLKKLRDGTQTYIALRSRDNDVSFPSASHYVSTHYQSAASELARTPARISRGLDHLLRNSNPVNIAPRFVVGAAHAIWRGVTDIPFEIGGVITAGAYGLYGGELGGSVANTALIAAPVVKFARGMRVIKVAEPATTTPIEVVDLTKSETAPLYPIGIPDGSFFVPSRGPSYAASGGGLTTHSGTGVRTWIMPFETPRPTIASWSFRPPPRITTRPRILPDETPLIFPGVAATVMREPELAKNEFVVLPGAENRTETIGDPASDGRQIGDLPVREDEEMSAGKGKTPKRLRRPKKKMGMFERPEDPELAEMMSRKLKLQVDVAFEKQHGFMLTNGLDNSTTVLDVGTGNGYFMCRVAQQHQQIKFTGIDYKEDMISRARETARKLKVGNVEWLTGDVSGNALSGMDDRFDGILMRYTDIHMPNIRRTLGLLMRTLKPGGRIWIFSVELDNMHSNNSGYNVYMRGTRRLYETLGMNAHLGSEMPVILRALGFESIVSTPDTMSNREMGTEAFQRFIVDQAIVWNRYDPTSFSRDDIEAVKDFARNVVPLPDFYGTHGVIMISAVKGKHK